MRFTVRQMLAAVVVVAVLLGLGFCLIGHAMTSVQIAFADEQTAIFEQMRREMEGSAGAEVGYLEYVVTYYPSGTKQSPGSRLDRIVERSRRSAAREIMAILRSRTDHDFGDDPRNWVEGLRTAGSGQRNTGP